MARERAKLTEKQERILIQCQLMGLTTRDMTQISNRLVALERETEYKKRVSEAVGQKTWTATDNGWKITAEDGHVYDCVKVKTPKSSRSWYDRRYSWDITITKPGTRFKEKKVSDVRVTEDPYLTAKLCPENSKDLLGLLQALNSGIIRWQI